MPSFSLIVATYGRAADLGRLLSSVAEQGFPDCEVIIVDQNNDDRLTPILRPFEQKLRLKRVRSKPGLSRARNVGFEYVTGEIVTFPDDDCWYSPGLLRRVNEFFNANPGYSMLSVGVQDERGIPSGNRWLFDRCDLNRTNLFRTSVGYALFVRRGSSAADTVRFDETLGLGSGTAFSSGEDTDYAYHLLRAGLKGRFDRSLTAHHPRRDMLSGEIGSRRAFSYGLGMGRVLRKQSLLLLCAVFVAFDLVRMAAAFTQGNKRGASLCLTHARGVARGYAASGAAD